MTDQHYDPELTKRVSIYDRIGSSGLLDIVWNSTPASLRWGLLYGLKAYHGILSKSYTLDDVRWNHEEFYRDSRMFRVLRPRLRRVRVLLKNNYRIPDS